MYIGGQIKLFPLYIAHKKVRSVDMGHILIGLSIL